LQDTHIVLFFLHIAGAVALLIWAVRLVRTGVERAFSNQLRLWMRRSSSNRFLAAVTGALSAMLLQSSTAVVVMVSNFVASGGIVAAAGLVILLGADFGSALVVQVLLVRQAFLVPLLLLIGVCLFLRGGQRRVRQIGRILIGLALIFASLDMIRAATAPLVDSEGAAAVMAYLGRDMVTAFLIGAGFTWIVHSSVAAILLFVALVAQGVMPQSAAIAMVLGANLGGAMIAYVLTLSAPIEARRMIVANVALRGGGAALVLLVLSISGLSLGWIGANNAAQVINLHLLFNLGLAVCLIPLCGVVMRVAEKMMKAPADPSSGMVAASALDPAALEVPDRALICATREIIHIAETIETMLRSVNGLYMKWDAATADAIEANGKRVRKMHFDVKLFLAKLNRGALDEDTSARSMELSSLAANLEAASDMIAQNMVGLAGRLDRESVRFSTVGQEEITDFHGRVLANVQLALHVLMTQELNEARELIAEKEDVRGLEQDLQRQHLSRLRDGLTESIATSNIHQETLRALKQINTSFSMVAHPILAETGDLLDSRLAAPSGGKDA
jgi:phosphate:Na+ symporter